MSWKKNKYKRPLCIMLALIFFLPAFGNLFGQFGTIRGKVQTEDGVKLPGVTVWVKDSQYKTVTDEAGAYSLPASNIGEIMVMAHLKGFQLGIEFVTVEVGKTVTADFTLKTEVLSYEITVTQEPPKLLTASENIGVVKVKPEQLAVLPALGEQDIFRSLQLMPGISGSNESSSGLYVRGGKPDQNLVIFDGMTIYHVDHFFGIFSAFNADAVEDVELFKGGFESKYGGRLSSVMEITGKSGRDDAIHFGGGINFLSYNGFLEVPLGKKASFFLAGRRSFRSSLYDKILDKYSDSPTPVDRGGPGGAGPGGGRFAAMFGTEPVSYFYDLNGKLIYRPSKKDVVSLSWYQGGDELDNSRELEMPEFMDERAEERGFEIDVEGEITDLTQWGNTGIGMFNWMRQWSNSFSTNLTVAYSRYFHKRDLDSSMNITRTNMDGEEVEVVENEADPPPGRDTERVENEENNLKDFSVRFNNMWEIGRHHRLEFGAEVVANKTFYNFGSTNFLRSDEPDAVSDPVSILDINNEGRQIAVYLQDTVRVFEFMTITPGLRATYFDLAEEYFFEPRFSLIIDISKKLKLKGAWGKYHQFANNLVREDVMQGDTDFWVLADGEVVPVSSSVHYIAGFSYESKNFLFDIEAYYKDLQGLGEYSTRQIRPWDPDFDSRDYFYTGTGTARGIEFLLQKKYGNYTGWICYTLGKVNYLFPEYGNESFPASHDVTHELKLVNSFKHKNWTLSATWIYATGKPYTEPLEAVQEIVYDPVRDREMVFNAVTYGPKNDSRLPDYHRLDLSITYDFNIGSSHVSAGVSLFNVYNRQNVWCREFDVIEGELTQTDVNYLGFTPSVFCRISF